MMLSRSVAVLAALLTVSPSLAARQSSSPATQSDASADVIIERRHRTMAFDRDGSLVQHDAVTIRVTSAVGVERAGTVSIPYMRDLTRAEVAYVRVRKPNGTLVETPVASAIDMPAEITTAAPTFTDLYVKHINVQGLEPGDAIEYAVTARQQSLIPNHFWHEHTFDTSTVIGEETVELSWPASVKVIVKNAPGIEPVVSSSGGRQVYRWRHTNPTPAARDDLILRHYARRDIRADVQITSFATWAELGQAVRDLWRDRAAVTPAIREKARQLTAAASTADEKARALYAFVATGIRYVAVSMGVGRYRPHAAAEVLVNGFGDCKDKHTLLVALLEAVDIRADGVLMGVDEIVDPDVPAPSQFDHVITQLPDVASSPVWLDATLGVAPYGFLPFPQRDEQVLRLPASGAAALVRTPREPTRVSRWRTETNGTINDQGRFDAAVRETFTGDIELVMRSLLRLVPQARLAEVFKGFPLVQKFGGTVTDIRMSPVDDAREALQIDYRLTVEPFSDWKNSKIDLPVVITFPEVPETDRPAVPLELGAPSEIVTVTRLELAPGVLARLAAGGKAGAAIDHDTGRYAATVAVDGQIVTAEQRWSLTVPEVPAAGIDAYRAFLAEAKAAHPRLDLTIAKPWAWGETAAIDWYGGSSPAATKALQSASGAATRRDFQEALAGARRVLADEPDNDSAWLVRAYVELSAGDRERGLDTLRTRAPKAGPALLKYFAGRLTAFGRHAEAASVWQQTRDRFPDDPEIPLYLGESLLRVGRHADAVAALEGQRDRQARSARFQLTIGRALLGAGRSDDGVRALGASADLDASAGNLNSVAWEMVTRGVALDEARAYSERSIKAVTGEINALALATTDAAGVRKMSALAAYWDTLGWIHVAQGNLDAAETWLLSAWAISEMGETADHLAALYRRRGDRASADRYALYGAAVAAPGTVRPPADVVDGPAWARRLNAARAEILGARTVPIPLHQTSGTADVWLLVSAGGRIADVRLIGGDKALGDAVRGLTAPWTAPDDTLKLLVRPGTARCLPNGECGLVIQRVTDVASGQ